MPPQPIMPTWIRSLAGSLSSFPRARLRRNRGQRRPPCRWPHYGRKLRRDTSVRSGHGMPPGEGEVGRWSHGDVRRQAKPVGQPAGRIFNAVPRLPQAPQRRNQIGKCRSCAFMVTCPVWEWAAHRPGVIFAPAVEISPRWRHSDGLGEPFGAPVGSPPAFEGEFACNALCSGRKSTARR